MNSDGLLHPQLWHPLYLSTDEVHIWCVSLDRSPQILSKLKSLLSPTELARASRFHFEKDRNHFIVSHGLLRSILGGYLGLEPSQIQFRYGPYGKPLVDIFHQVRPFAHRGPPSTKKSVPSGIFATTGVVSPGSE